MFNELQKHKEETAKKQLEEAIKKMECVAKDVVDLLKSKDLTVEECKRILNACQMSVDRSIMGRKMSDFI